jgi:predicted metal-dependent hydrolase
MKKHLPKGESIPCSHTHRPSNLHIVVRRVSYEYQTSLKADRYWFNNDPIGTHFINALQSTFPEGELFFIQAAVDGAGILRQHGSIDNQMEHDLKLFQQQEAHHSQQHRLWNKALVEMGYEELALYDKNMHNLDVWSRRHIPAKLRLAVTAAAEHYTASIAYLFTYVNQDLLRKSAAPFSSILLYHAMEEIEHKSVCFDLSQKLSKSYMMRIISLIFITFDLAINIYIRMRYLLKKDGLWGWRYKVKVGKFFLGRNGLLKGLFPRIIQYLRPSFHPWMTDERKGIEHIFKDILMRTQIEPFRFE